MHTFGHIMAFPCVKQPEGSQKEAYYALYQMRAYVCDHHNLTLPNSLKSWAEHDVGWPSDTSASRPPSPPQGPMTRSQAKALHDKVNLLLNTLDLEHTVNGSLPHGNTICAVRYEPHGETTKDEEHEEEAWKRQKKKSKQATDRLKPALTPAIAGHRL
jgi:hypothetical protein